MAVLPLDLVIEEIPPMARLPGNTRVIDAQVAKGSNCKPQEIGMAQSECDSAVLIAYLLLL